MGKVYRVATWRRHEGRGYLGSDGAAACDWRHGGPQRTCHASGQQGRHDGVNLSTTTEDAIAVEVRRTRLVDLAGMETAVEYSGGGMIGSGRVNGGTDDPGSDDGTANAVGLEGGAMAMTGHDGL